MGIRESDGDPKAKMNTAIGSMKADGTLNTMIKSGLVTTPTFWSACWLNEILAVAVTAASPVLRPHG